MCKIYARLYKLEGIEEVSSLEASDRLLRVARFFMHKRIDLESLLLSKNKSNRHFPWQSFNGIVTCRLLALRYKPWNFCNLPIEVGFGLLIPLSDKFRAIKLLKFPISSGILPENLQLPKLKYSSDVEIFPNELGRSRWVFRELSCSLLKPWN